MSRKILLISNYNANFRPWNGVVYEFYRVIAGLEDATIMAPEAAPARGLAGIGRLGRELANRMTGHDLPPLMRRTDTPGSFDFCFYMCQFAREIPEIDRIRGWREKSGFAAAFVLETWTSEMEARRADLKRLDAFDHVFVLNAASIPTLQRYTKTPVSFLPTGIDCQMTCPPEQPPGRVIDVFSMGRRRQEVHKTLLEMAEGPQFFYVHDVWRNMLARGWAEARAANAAHIQRSRYFIAWDPASARPAERQMIRDDGPISTRYFEGAAGGAVMIGSKPRSPEFAKLFDWPDVVVELPQGQDIRALIETLEEDPARVHAARTANIAQSLRRHDWAYRWDTVLGAAGLPRNRRHGQRIEDLRRMAAQAGERAGSGARDDRFGIVRPIHAAQ